jgi:hypothetical protein
MVAFASPALRAPLLPHYTIHPDSLGKLQCFHTIELEVNDRQQCLQTQGGVLTRE